MYLKSLSIKNYRKYGEEAQTINFAHSKWPEMSGYEDEGNKLNITEEYISKSSSLIVGKNIGDAFTGMMSGLESVLRWDDER